VWFVNRILILKGIDTASDVANLVARAFSPTSPVPNRRNGILASSQSAPTGGQIPGENHMINSMLRLMGLDPGKVGAMALNGVIFLAQMVRTGMNQVLTVSMTTIWDWYMVWISIRDRLAFQMAAHDSGAVNNNGLNDDEYNYDTVVDSTTTAAVTMVAPTNPPPTVIEV
jgi:hypothetical protein